MAVTRSSTFPVRSEMDVVQVRQAARQWAADLGFSLVEQTKMVTAASLSSATNDRSIKKEITHTSILLSRISYSTSF